MALPLSPESGSVPGEAAPTQVGRVDQRRAGWIQLRDKRVGIIIGGGAIRCLDGTWRDRKVSGVRLASHVHVAGSIYANRTACILPLLPPK